MLSKGIWWFIWFVDLKSHGKSQIFSIEPFHLPQSGGRRLQAQEVVEEVAESPESPDDGEASEFSIGVPVPKTSTKEDWPCFGGFWKSGGRVS